MVSLTSWLSRRRRRVMDGLNHKVKAHRGQEEEKEEDACEGSGLMTQKQLFGIFLPSYFFSSLYCLLNDRFDAPKIFAQRKSISSISFCCWRTICFGCVLGVCILDNLGG